LHWSQRLNENWSTNVGLNYTKGQGFFEQYKADEDISGFNGIVVDTNGNGETDLIVRRWLDNSFYVANLNVTYQDEQIEIMNGLSYSTYSNDHYGEVIWAKQFAANANIRDRYYFSDASKKDFSIFSKATYKISDKLSVYADFQGRFVNYQTKGITSDIAPIDVNSNFSFFNPKFGLSYVFNKNQQFYFSFGIANKEPNRNDFEGGIRTHENLHDYELGWRYSNKGIHVNSNLYLMQYTNQLVLTGSIDNSGNPIRATSGKSYRFGLEIDADIRINKSFSLRPNIALSDNKNLDFRAPIDGVIKNLGKTNLSFSPNVIAGNALVYHPSENFQMAFLSKYVGTQYMSNLNSTVSKNDVLEDYFTSDFNISYEWNTNRIFRSIVFTGLINNVFSREYVDRGYYYTYDDTWSNANQTTTLDGAGYYPQATRNFLVGMTLKF